MLGKVNGLPPIQVFMNKKDKDKQATNDFGRVKKKLFQLF